MALRGTQPVTLIGGAAVCTHVIDRALALAPRVIAADGGADSALAHGVMPDAVIGDFDSISPGVRAEIPDDRLHHIPEQDTTDFDKCLRSIDAPLIIGVGFSGARLDHQLATYNSLVKHPTKRCILLGAAELVFLAPPSLYLDLSEGCAVSLFPMGAVEGVSDGLEWPIAGITFAPDGRIGTSNRSTGPVDLTLTAPKMLVILPAVALETVVKAFEHSNAMWPAR